MYVAFLREWDATFGAGRVHVELLDDLASNGSAVVLRSMAHLRLRLDRGRDAYVATLQPHRPRNHGRDATEEVALWPATEYLLRTAYCPFTRALARALVDRADPASPAAVALASAQAARVRAWCATPVGEGEGAGAGGSLGGGEGGEGEASTAWARSGWGAAAGVAPPCS
jgi:hypothetical protein